MKKTMISHHARRDTRDALDAALTRRFKIERESLDLEISEMLADVRHEDLVLFKRYLGLDTMYGHVVNGTWTLFREVK